MTRFLPGSLHKRYHEITSYDAEIADPVEKIKTELHVKSLFWINLIGLIGMTLIQLNPAMTITGHFVIGTFQIVLCTGLILLNFKIYKNMAFVICFFVVAVDFGMVYADDKNILPAMGNALVIPNFLAYLTQSKKMSFVGFLLASLLIVSVEAPFKEHIQRECTTRNLAQIQAEGRMHFIVFAFYNFALNALISRRFDTILETLCTTLKAEEQVRQEKELLHSKSMFFSCFSHEMRNPLNCILGSMDYAIKYAADEPIRDILATGKACGSMLLNLINNILDMGKIDSHNICLNEDTKDSKVFITNIWRVTQELFKKKKQQGEIFVDRDFPAYITIDDSRLTQVIVNLVSNACKFTEEGKSIRIVYSFKSDNEPNNIPGKFLADLDFNQGISQREGTSPQNKRKAQPVSLSKKLSDQNSFGDEHVGTENLDLMLNNLEKKTLHHVLVKSQAVSNKYALLYTTYRSPSHRIEWNPRYDLAASHQSGVIKIEVIDTGCGITSEVAGKMFKPFAQNKKSFSEMYEGTGLGLYITKSLVDLMKGNIAVDSQLEVGSTFAVTIPNVPLLAKNGAHLKTESINKQSQFSKIKIVVISEPKTLELFHVLDDALDQGIFSEYSLERTDRFRLPDVNHNTSQFVSVYYIYDALSISQSDLERLALFKLTDPKDYILLYYPDEFSQDKSSIPLPLENKIIYGVPKLTRTVFSQSKETLHLIKSKFTLLIVDDDTFNLKVLSLFLTKEGYNVYTAQNGQLGYEVYCSHPDEISMVILDYDMPICDGPTCCEMILRFMNQNRIEPIPIYALTGNVSQESKVRMMEAGIQKTWNKPAKMEEIMSEIFYLLSNKGSNTN